MFDQMAQLIFSKEQVVVISHDCLVSVHSFIEI